MGHNSVYCRYSINFGFRLLKSGLFFGQIFREWQCFIKIGFRFLEAEKIGFFVQKNQKPVSKPKTDFELHL